MDLFPHDKLTKYLANRPNFPPSPQVLSLKEESSEVKRLLKLGRAGGGFARCSEGGKEISRTISNGCHRRFHDDWDISFQIFSRTVLQSDIPRNP